MKFDGAVHNLVQLERTASTARVLNLPAIGRRLAQGADRSPRPLFDNPMLARAIVIKHRLRRHEYELFDDYRLLATKVILPIDPDDLGAGAYSVFIGQRDYEEQLGELLGELLGAEAGVAEHDRRVLRVLDETPTLDPFVLREQFRRAGLDPSSDYFDIGPADMGRMLAFVEREVAPLAAMTAAGAPGEDASARLARKLLSRAVDQETEPLRRTLKLRAEDYSEGMFCWKGFLYYKWCLAELAPHVGPVSLEIDRAKLRAPVRPDTRTQIELMRGRLRQSIAAACDSVRSSIGVYDNAYVRLVTARDPRPFRQFLLRAPSLFCKLGEGIGAVQHVVSYWRYRFPPDVRALVDPADMIEILEDFGHALHAFDPRAEEETCRFERTQLA